jgi:imidazoleglycerol phosphate synthase glutamine amidotransferase subunit HisH
MELCEKMKDSKISKEMTEESNFYFVHSYHGFKYDDNVFKTNYGYVVSGLENGTYIQFHPEKVIIRIQMFKKFWSYMSLIS